MPPADSTVEALFRDGKTFLAGLRASERHALGAHYTCERDIQKIVQPTIVLPWKRRIATARTEAKLQELHAELCRFRILDPACGCGNFLLIALHALLALEVELRRRLRHGALRQHVSAHQLFGIDIDRRAVQRAKALLQRVAPGSNLDKNFACCDALFCSWPKVDAIIGNPPFQSKNSMQQAFGVAYLHRLRSRYPDVPGRADYCVYWFRRAHDELPPGGRAGLVGTNTIAQNYSRQGGLDYVVANHGTIVTAVASQTWQGDAGVNVAIVNWVKRVVRRPIARRDRRPPDGLRLIPASLSTNADVTRARPVAANQASMGCYQGQTHGHRGFVLSAGETRDLVLRSPACREVLFPYLTGDELLDRMPETPWRWVLDFHPRSLRAAQAYPEALARIETTVLTARRRAAAAEAARNREANALSARRLNWHHRRFLEKWWLLSYPRPELIARLRGIPRYIACSRVTTYPIFAFVSSGIHPSDVVQVFPFSDDYSFGILQSSLHWDWFRAKCSTLGNGPRYTSETVFDTFPWPQRPTEHNIRRVADAAVGLRACREMLMRANRWSLRQLYRACCRDASEPLAQAQERLDRAVRAAYRMPNTVQMLDFLLALNLEVAARGQAREPVLGPGLPAASKAFDALTSADCLMTPPHIITTDVGNCPEQCQ